MDEVARLNTDSGGTQLLFHCPGCDHLHAYRVKSTGDKGPVWNWNGSLTKPTLTPSLLNHHKWPDEPDNRCHLFVTDGEIHYCGDCTHELSGKIVVMEPRYGSSSKDST